MDLALNNLQGWYAIKPKQPANQVLMLNWIVWNRTAYRYKNEFGIK